MATRIIISDTILTGHPESVRAGILAEYSGIIQAEIEIRDSGFVADIAYAQSINAIEIVRSIADLNSCIETALLYYRNIQSFFAFLSNDHTEEAVPTSIPNVITVGAGVLANETAYGQGLEFWDYDLDMVDPDLSSFSNGRVAGKILKIKDTLGCSWWEARYRARMTASENGVWSLYNGYGKIDVAKALVYSGAIIHDPYYDNNPSEPMQRAGYRF